MNVRVICAVLITLTAGLAAFGQNEQAPIIERQIEYRSWTLKSVRDGSDVELRKAIAGKRLVIVVYFAPWCGNWRHDAPFLQKFYERYKDKGLEIIGVGEYDPVDSIKSSIDYLKVTFPVVYESTDRSARQQTLHYNYRRETGDTRNWGSPWYIMIEPEKIEKKGDILLKKAFVINGEMIESEGEKFIRERLGLQSEGSGSGGSERPVTASADKIEICEPVVKTAGLVKP
ncbi:MAG: TlpA family protein disulfide reductase [Acidobacteria bacterium]|nr:TlpA family protein disulfide reductase [Acidobacteriota bacterium]MCW5948511.1 TlpA family protein disulfide reductase [Pyrinomonadaceae bacterium]